MSIRMANEGKKCRLIFRKSDNKLFEVQIPHLFRGEYVYLPINDNFYSIESTQLQRVKQ